MRGGGFRGVTQELLDGTVVIMLHCVRVAFVVVFTLKPYCLNNVCLLPPFANNIFVVSLSKTFVLKLHTDILNTHLKT